jgi:hypothetical protein
VIADDAGLRYQDGVLVCSQRELASPFGFNVPKEEGLISHFFSRVNENSRS